LLQELYNPRCEPPWSDVDLRHKVASASTAAAGKPRGYLLGIGIAAPPPPVASAPLLRATTKALYDPAYLERFTSRSPDSVDTEYLEARSQFTCHNRSPAGFLHKVFSLGESVWITSNAESREGLIWTHDGPVQNLAELDHLRANHRGVWFLSN